MLGLSITKRGRELGCVLASAPVYPPLSVVLRLRERKRVRSRCAPTVFVGPFVEEEAALRPCTLVSRPSSLGFVENEEEL